MPEIHIFSPGMARTWHAPQIVDRDNKASADAYINGSYNGAFTYNVCKHIRDAKGQISRGGSCSKGCGPP